MSIRVAVDAMGGDRAPEEIVAGALAARTSGLEPILFGPAGIDTGGLELVETTSVIGMDEKPAEAVRAKQDSSLVAARLEDAIGRTYQSLGLYAQAESHLRAALEKRTALSGVEDRETLLAFRGTLNPNAIPSTVIIDREGRVAASVLGEITRTTLYDLVEEVAAS